MYVCTYVYVCYIPGVPPHPLPTDNPSPSISPTFISNRRTVFSFFNPSLARRRTTTYYKYLYITYIILYYRTHTE